MGNRIEKDWITKAGLRAVVLVVQFEAGFDRHRCGYVGVPKGHILFGKGYSEDVPELKAALERAKEGDVGKRGAISIFAYDGESAQPDIVFDVHGGLTYADGRPEYPAPSDLWWFGFDAAHSGDAQMSDHLSMGLEWGEVRSLEYMERECESLATQIVQATAVQP